MGKALGGRSARPRLSLPYLIRATLFLFVALAISSSFFLFTFSDVARNISSLDAFTILPDSQRGKVARNNWSFPELFKANVTGPILRMIPEAEYNRTSGGNMKCPISFFVYDDLPGNLSTDLERIVMLDGAAGEGNRTTNENAEIELGLLRLFRTSPCRVYDPATADYYIAPYMHATHCQSSPGLIRHGCGNLARSVAQQVIQTLRYYSDAPKRHVFLLGWGTFMNLPDMENQPVTLSPGPKNAGGSGNGTIVIPLLNDNIRCQPSMLPQSMTSFEHRKQAFTFIYGGINKYMRRKSGRRFRIYFAKAINDSTTPTIGGMPYTMLELAPSTKSVDVESVLALYRDSILCPILPGDISWQRRFFDVILSGCIPLVVEWALNDKSRSWFVPSNIPGLHLFSVQQSYPFFTGEYLNSSMEVDYDSFVAKIVGNAADERDFSGLRGKIETILADKEGLKRRQRNLAKYATRLTYGLGADAHKYKDAFWSILQALKIDQTYEKVPYNAREWLHRKKNKTVGSLRKRSPRRRVRLH